MGRLGKGLTPLLLIACVASFLTASTLSAHAAPRAPVSKPSSAHPADIPYRGPISPCTSPKQFECIESVHYRKSGAAWKMAEAVPRRVGQWRVVHDGAEVIVKVSTELMTPAFDDANPDIGPRLMVAMEREPDREHPSFRPGDVPCDLSRPATCVVYGPALPPDLELRVTVRLSWMKPVGASGYGADAMTRLTPVRGGSRWVLEGRQSLNPFSAQDRGDDLPADYMEPVLIFWIVHADPAWEQTALNSECAPAGFPHTAANASWAGPPMWNPVTNGIDFNIGAGHRDVRGRLYRGFFSARLPISWIECSWGIPRFAASEFSVTVTTEEGEDIAATRLLRVRGGHLEVTVTGFHYSSPTISLVRKATR